MKVLDNIEDADLMIVMGTALSVAPFNHTINCVPKDVPKVLINMENTAVSGFDFDNSEEYPERLLLKGKCDEIVKEIAKDCGWESELNELCKDFKSKQIVADVDSLGQ